MSRARVRRPLLALIALVLALVIGYGIRAAQSDGGHQPPRPVPSSSTR